MLASIGLAFVGGGISAMMHHGVEATFVMCFSLFVPIIMNTLGLPRALEKDWYHAAISVVVLPLFFFLWAVGVGVMREHHPELAYPFLALGLGAFGLAARPSHSAQIVSARTAEQH
jgi:hypothetical protein